MDKILTTDDLSKFFGFLKILEAQYTEWAEESPKTLVINPDIVGKLARVTGFYQRPELKSEVTAYAPVVRYFKLDRCVVTLQEDYDEKFLHFE